MFGRYGRQETCHQSCSIAIQLCLLVRTYNALVLSAWQSYYQVGQVPGDLLGLLAQDPPAVQIEASINLSDSQQELVRPRGRWGRFRVAEFTDGIDFELPAPNRVAFQVVEGRCCNGYLHAFACLIEELPRCLRAATILDLGRDIAGERLLRDQQQ
jgi:hypothetical protein